MKRLLATLLLFFALVSPLGAGQVAVEAFRAYYSPALEICALIAVPTGQGAAFLYGVHVTNTAASAVWLQLFNATTQPAAAAVPRGSASWNIPATSERDIDISSVMGLGFNTGLAVCTSTTQATFTATGATSGFIVTYR